MENVLLEKLKEFPDGMLYQKKVHDMKMLTEIYENYKNRELTKEELMFLYEIDGKISGFGYDEDPRIKEIKDKRNKRRDLSIAFDCRMSQIGFSKSDLYKNQLMYYEGDINSRQYEEMKKNNFNLPYYVDGNVNLEKITSAKGLLLPSIINGTLDLGDLTSPEYLKFSENFRCKYLVLCSLTSAYGLKFPKKFWGSINLTGLTSSLGLDLPQEIEGSLDLGGIDIIDNLVLSNRIGGFLDLNRLKMAKKLVLPQIIEKSLELYELESLLGITLPQSVNGNILYKGKWYTLEQIRKLQQDEIEKNSNYNLNDEIKTNRNRGFITVVYTITFVLVVCILSVIIGLLLINQ